MSETPTPNSGDQPRIARVLGEPLATPALDRLARRDPDFGTFVRTVGGERKLIDMLGNSAVHIGGSHPQMFGRVTGELSSLGVRPETNSKGRLSREEYAGIRNNLNDATVIDAWRFYVTTNRVTDADPDRLAAVRESFLKEWKMDLLKGLDGRRGLGAVILQGIVETFVNEFDRKKLAVEAASL